MNIWLGILIEMDNLISKVLYIERNNAIELWTSIFLALLTKVSFALLIAPIIVFSFYLYFNMELESDSIFKPHFVT